MADTTNSPAKSRKRIERPFPRRTLEEALRVPTALKNHNAGNPWAPDQVAKAINVAPKSANFFYLTASARDYGLTEGTRDASIISLTELGRNAIYPESPEQENNAKLQAFLKVDLFRRLLEYYKGNNLPEEQFLSNVLKTQFNLDEELHKEFRELFDKNCRYLGIGSNYPSNLPVQSSYMAGDDSRQTSVTVGTPKIKESGNEEASKVCFIIMPFNEREDSHPVGFFNEVLNSILTPAITEAGFVVRTALRQGSDVIQATIVNDLLAADLVVADLTEHNPNVLFELGMRMAEEKPVALIRAKGTGDIFDVDNMLRLVEYDPSVWPSTVKSDIPRITSHVKATWENRDSGSSFRSILEQRKPQSQIKT